MTAAILVDLVQGTPEWLTWRNTGIGASDTAVIMGESEDSTPYLLWAEKSGLKKDDGKGANFGMLIGHEREPQMRAGIELELNAEFKPFCFEHPVYRWLKASTDGFSYELNYGFEMKFVGKAYYEGTEIKRKHYIQMQQQMLVTGAPFWYYVKTIDGQYYKVEKVEADQATQEAILQAGGNFMDFLLNKIPPPYCDRDWVPNDAPDLVAMVAAFKAAKDADNDGSMKRCRDEVMSLVRHARTAVGNARVTRLEKSKSIRFVDAKEEAS